MKSFAETVIKLYYSSFAICLEGSCFAGAIVLMSIIEKFSCLYYIYQVQIDFYINIHLCQQRLLQSHGWKKCFFRATIVHETYDLGVDSMMVKFTDPILCMAFPAL